MGRTFKKVKEEKNKISACQPMCPWCGSEETKFLGFGSGWYECQCCDCQHNFRPYKGWIVIIDLSIYFSLRMFFTSDVSTILKFVLGIIGFSLFAYRYVYLTRMPYKRIIERGYESEEFLGIAEMDWLSHREGGLRFPNLIIWNHYILGVCFVDAEGKPVSQTGYIRVNKRLFRRTRKIYQITDNIKYDEKTMSEFVVFYKRKRVGKGRMIYGKNVKRDKRGINKINVGQSMCPWCGGMDAKPELSLENRFRYHCRECGRYYESYFKRFISASFIWFLNIFIIFFTHRRPAAFLLCVSGFLFVYVIIIVCKTPYRRSISTKEYEYYPEEFLGIAEMDWLSHREGGLRFPNLIIWNHYILGVCFVDAEGKPISQTGYIRVNKRLFRKTRKIYQITDNIKYDEKTMSEFVVFYKRKRVGKGRMISNSKRSN